MSEKCPKCDEERLLQLAEMWSARGGRESALEQVQMAWHALDAVDLIHRLRRQLGEKETRIAELEAEWTCEEGCEKCQCCGRRYETGWAAPDELWYRIAGKPGGMLCPMCFDLKCRQADLTVSWRVRLDDDVEAECQEIARLNAIVEKSEEDRDYYKEAASSNLAAEERMHKEQMEAIAKLRLELLGADSLAGEAAEQARPDRDVPLGRLAAGGQGEGEKKTHGPP